MSSVRGRTAGVFPRLESAAAGFGGGARSTSGLLYLGGSGDGERTFAACAVAFVAVAGIVDGSGRGGRWEAGHRGQHWTGARRERPLLMIIGYLENQAADVVLSNASVNVRSSAYGPISGLAFHHHPVFA